MYLEEHKHSVHCSLCFCTVCLFVCLLCFLNVYLLIFLSVPGLHCCAWAFSSCGKQGLLFVTVHGLHTAVISLAEVPRLLTYELQ